ncbi:hypothetical protein Fmac_009663 [Flemingia macrophylla]|uniref:Uncharacterized protein n=1 Tax=Flemingia macrophylla TaxID=520843 RepID=A0ABD1N0Z0_9FABA
MCCVLLSNSANELGLVRREAEGERKLSLLAVVALEGGAGGGAEGAHRLRFLRTRHRNKTQCQGLVQMPARPLATRTRWNSTVALPQRLLHSLAPLFPSHLSSSTSHHHPICP